MMPEFLRTPDARFENLPDFDYPVRHADDLPGYEGLRCAWIEAGPPDAEHTFLCLHGEPTWSFLYRRMIPYFLLAGGRVVAPDLFGFGRSDKPVHREDYTFDFHRNHLLALAERLDLADVTLVVQDWGGLLGLTLPVDEGFRHRLRRLIIMNTALGVGTHPGEGFEAWKNHALTTPDFRAGAIVARGAPHLTEAEIAAYDAPFPDERFQAGARQFPALVPVSPEMNGVEVSRRAATFWSEEWSGPTFMAIGAADPVLGPEVMGKMQRLIRGCPEPMVIDDAGHFVQEWGESIARAALEHFGGR